MPNAGLVTAIPLTGVAAAPIKAADLGLQAAGVAGRTGGVQLRRNQLRLALVDGRRRSAA